MDENEEKLRSLKEDRIEKDLIYSRELNVLVKDLRAHAMSNIAYYRGAVGVNYERLFLNFTKLNDHLDNGIEPGIESLLSIAHKYDYDYTLPANGYRSVVRIIHKCIAHVLQLTRYMTLHRASLLFRAGHYGRELEAYVNTIGQLRACLYYLCRLLEYCEDGTLFPDQDLLTPEEFEVAEKLMMEVETLSQETFYGRCLGFQYCESMKTPLKTIILAMASFADSYHRNSTVMKLASSVIGTGKYFMDPESRAAQVVEVTRNKDIHFCKAFWSIAENTLMHQLPLFVCPSVALDHVLALQPDTFELPLVRGGAGCARINPPSAHTGVGPVNTRLISYRIRQGQEQWTIKRSPSTPQMEPPRSTNPYLPPPSPCLIIHCHGGGFVAQSSASHQVYLRHWAKELDVPILCVDYSLAPENPFPRQLEEVFYAYCWALKNSHLLGSTCQRVCIVGDSAGGNLAIAVALRAAHYGIQTPVGLMSAYGVTLVRYVPSPSRITSLLDPLLPIGVVSHVLAAYAGVTNKTNPLPDVCSSGKTENVNDKTKELTRSPAVPQLQKQPSPPHKSTHNTTRHKSVGSNDSGFHDVIDTKPGISKQVELSNPVVPAAAGGAIKMDHSKGQSSNGFVLVSESGEDEHVVFSVEPTRAEEESSSTAASFSDKSSNMLSRQGMTLDLSTTKNRKGMARPTVIHSPSMPTLRSMSYDASSSAHHSASISLTSGSSTPSGIRSPLAIDPQLYAQIRHFAQSPVQQFKHLPIATNPYMSPYLATDEQLKDLCPVYLVACHLDPMLDDSVMFARRLKSIKKEVHLDVLQDLPHGFLNFTLVSRDASAGSQVCINRIKDILHLHPVADSFEIIEKKEVDILEG